MRTIKDIVSTLLRILPSLGATEVFRGMTKCHFGLTKGSESPLAMVGTLGVGFMGLLGLLVSCQSDEEPIVPAIEVRGYVSWFDDNIAVTRAWLPPTGYSLYTEDDKTIGVCLTQDGQAPKMGHFFKVSGQWRTNLEDIEATTYYLYGYAPHTPGMSCSISSSSTPGDNSSYSTGAVLTLENVPTIMSSDLCVVIGAKNGETSYSDVADYEVAGLRRGSFSYEAKAIGEGLHGNYVFMLFDHLYAALNLHIRIHGEYDELRTIKIKEMKIQSSDDGVPTMEKATVTVGLTATEGTNPITGITYTPTGAAGNETAVFESREGEALTTDYNTIVSHFMPQGVTKLVMTTTYDVYDKNNPANLVREGCKSKNVLDFTKLFDRFDEVKTGTRYNIYLTVHPSYLYMLSDPDLNNPTMTVE